MSSNVAKRAQNHFHQFKIGNLSLDERKEWRGESVSKKKIHRIRMNSAALPFTISSIMDFHSLTAFDSSTQQQYTMYPFDMNCAHRSLSSSTSNIGGMPSDRRGMGRGPRGGRVGK